MQLHASYQVKISVWICVWNAGKKKTFYSKRIFTFVACMWCVLYVYEMAWTRRKMDKAYIFWRACLEESLWNKKSFAHILKHSPLSIYYYTLWHHISNMRCFIWGQSYVKLPHDHTAQNPNMLTTTPPRQLVLLVVLTILLHFLCSPWIFTDLFSEMFLGWWSSHIKLRK